jgi:hypothetical protein
MKMHHGQIDLLGADSRTLRAHKDSIRSAYASELRSASLFLMLIDSADGDSVRRNDALIEALVTRLNVTVHRVRAADLPWLVGAPQSLFLLRFAIGNMSPESAREEIEIILGNILDIRIGGRINRAWLFIPRTGAVSCRSYAHGQGHYYRYRLAAFKLDSVPPLLSDFLLRIASGCPDHYFLSGPRASSLDIPLAVGLEQSSGHAMVQLAQQGLRVRKLKSAHEDLEKYLLESDPETIACEVPIWFEPSELEELPLGKRVETGTLTGHIDVLRWENDAKIGIWDYKPCAGDEVKAHVQVFLYALMLSKRTGLSLKEFRCGYFDSARAFVFRPAEVSWPARHGE